jgi:autotransporter-associated beta strand protein
MIRNTLAANSAYVDNVLWPSGDAQFQSRSAAGQSAVNNLTSGSVNPPYWVKLIQTGTNFTSFISSNGASWTSQGTVGVNMGATVYVGMPVSSDDTAAINQATFDNVSVSGTLPQAPQLSNYQTPMVIAFGSNLTYQITASNSPAYYNATGLPAGLSVNASTGAITGVPAALGTSVVTISAGNDGGEDTENLTIEVVNQPPGISSTLSVTGTLDVPFSYPIAATNSPTGYSASGLPAGLTLNPDTGLISGTPALTGSFDASISANNLNGSGTASLLIAIEPPVPPVISSTASVTGTNGSAFSYQISGTNNPTSFSATGLPTGLTVNPATGLITGIPTISGTFNATISGINLGGTGSGILTITLVNLPGTVNRWTWDPLTRGNGSDGSGTWDNVTAIFSSGTADVAYNPGVVAKSVGTTAIGSNTITVTGTAGLVLGEALSLSNFAVGTLVSSVNGSTVTLSSTATTAVGANTVFTFVDANDVGFGNGTDPAGTVTVSGTQYAGSMIINPAGSGNYTFSNGSIILGSRNGSTGMLTLNDSATIGSSLNLQGITFAMAGKTLTLSGVSGNFADGNTVIGGASTAISQSSAIVFSSGTCTTGYVMMWNLGNITNETGGMTIQAGATLNQTNNVFLGYFSNNSGLVTLNGGIWDVSGSLILGRTNAGEVIVQSGTVSAQGIITVGMNDSGVLDINGGSLTSSTTLAINSGNGNGTVNITGGTTKVVTVNFGGGGYGGASTSGTGALNLIDGSFYVGNGGIVSTGSGTSACSITLSSGTLAASAGWTCSLPMSLTNTVTVQTADSSGTSHNISLSGNLSGAGGLIETGGGLLTLSGSNSYSGGTTVASGTLMVGNVPGSAVGTGPVTVSNGGALTGAGVLGGAVAMDGRLSPGLAGNGTLTINGSLAVSANGSLQYELGAASGSVIVNGNLTLGGTLDLVNSGGLTTGTYTLITYTGSLTNNGLVIGSMPPGFNYNVETSIAGQVNLVISNETPFQLWQAAMFGVNASDEAISGDLAVNNTAGTSNLLAYALGLNPFTVQVTKLPALALEESGGSEYLTLQFERNTAATDITYIVEGTGSLGLSSTWTTISTFSNGAWQPAGNVTETGSAPEVNVEVSDTVPILSSPARFIRLEVTH